LPLEAPRCLPFGFDEGAPLPPCIGGKLKSWFVCWSAQGISGFILREAAGLRLGLALEMYCAFLGKFSAASSFVCAFYMRYCISPIVLLVMFDFDCFKTFERCWLPLSCR